MTLEQGLNINKEICKLQDVFNTVGLLECNVNIENNIIILSITKKLGLINNVDKKVADFLYKYITKYIKQEIKDVYYDGLHISPILGYGDVLVITYDCKAINNNGNQKDEKIFDSIIKSLYYAVDEAKVEFCFYIEKDDTHDIPNEIYWQLDNWNDELVYDGMEDECIPPELIKVSKFKKEYLYGICLGYYSIDLHLFEGDVVPELIGVLFESTEDFCYITSYEDEEYVYLYSVCDLNDDNIFDIEEGLFNLLGLIKNSEDKNGMTLEDYFLNIKNKE